MNAAADKLRTDTLRQAIDYGYTMDYNRYMLVAPLGKFEGEPWYVVYFYNLMLEGDGEPMYDGETVMGDLFELTDDEREAFELDASTVAVALWHSEAGFESLELLGDQRYVHLLNLPEEPTYDADV